MVGAAERVDRSAGTACGDGRPSAPAAVKPTPQSGASRRQNAFFHARSVGERRDVVRQRAARMRRGGARAPAATPARRNGLVARSSPIVDGSVGSPRVALGLLARVRARERRDCRARPRARSEGSRACTRGRSRRASPAAARRASTATSTSAPACPRTGGRSPPRTACRRRTAAGAPPTSPTYAMWPAVWPGMSSTSNVERRCPGTSTRSPSRQRLRAAGNRLARRSEHGHRTSARAARDRRRRDRA